MSLFFFYSSRSERLGLLYFFCFYLFLLFFSFFGSFFLFFFLFLFSFSFFLVFSFSLFGGEISTPWWTNVHTIFPEPDSYYLYFTCLYFTFLYLGNHFGTILEPFCNQSGTVLVPEWQPDDNQRLKSSVFNGYRV